MARQISNILIYRHFWIGGNGDDANKIRRGLMPRWSVDFIRHRAEHLGEVDAPDEQAAIKRAAEVFDIPPERLNRITVTKTSKKDEDEG
jgi:hypothetical protein